MKRKSWELKLIFLVLVAVFAIFLAVPAIRLLLKSFLGEDGLTGAYYLDVFSGKGFTTALGNSFAVSIVSALVAVGIAFVMAYIIHYTRLPRGFKRFVQAVATLPMFLPTITYGFAIIYSFGKQGLITRLLGHQFFDIYGFGGLLVGYVIYTVPVAFLLIHNTMGYVDKKTLVVSKAMGDRDLATFWIAILRPLLGTLAGAFIQAFFLCFTDFGIPASVGGGYEVIATLLYNQMLGGIPDFNRGAVIAMILLIPSIGSMKPGEKAGVLLWQGESPLAWVDGKRLFLNWPWEKSNADRVPAPLLMTRRFMQSVQENLPGTHYGNLPGGTLLSMPAGGKLIQTMPGGERRETVFNGRLPEETGYVEIFPPGEGKTPLFQGSVWFSDARMGDFSHCSTFDTGLPQPHEEALRHMKRDPLAPLWLALAFLALILSWLPPVPDTSLRP